MNRLVLHIHQWTALFVFLPLLIIAVTGVMIAYRPELNRVIFPTMTLAQGTSETAFRDRLSTFVDQHPERELIYVELAREDDETDLLLSRDATDAMYLTAMSPRSGAIQADKPFVQHWLYLAFFIHTTLLAHRYVVGVFGIALVAMALTGLFIWWPRGAMTLGKRLRTTYEIRKPHWPRDLHRAFGLSLSALFLISGLTGIAMIFGAAFQPTLDRAMGSPSRPDHMAIHGHQAVIPDPLSYADAVDTAHARFPGARVVGVGQGAHDGKPSSLVMVRLRQEGDPLLQGATALWIESHTGEVLITQDGQRDPLSNRLLYDVAWTLHTGTIIGGAGRIIMLMSGIGLIAMIATAFMSWRRGSKQKKQARRKRAAGFAEQNT